jgi:GxxExxY protein
MSLLYERESYQILGACFEVYKEKGCGFLEAVYQECLQIEFGLEQVPFVPQPLLSLAYKGQPLIQRYAPDFVCFNLIIVELKAASSLCDEHRPGS